MKKKCPVGILGMTGYVGRTLAHLLENHPWFDLKSAFASSNSAGRPFKEWDSNSLFGDIIVKPCDPDPSCSLVFSALPSDVAGPLEMAWVERGIPLITNASTHRFHSISSLMVPEVNGKTSLSTPIMANPNCTTIGLSIALKPLYDAFGFRQVHVTTFQAISGMGMNYIPSAIEDNIIPHIPSEEEKIQKELPYLLGKDPFTLEVACHRVPVTDGHLAHVSVSFQTPVEKEEIIEAWETFRGEPQTKNLPSAPNQPIHYFSEIDFPQPKIHRDLEKGMAVSVGRLRRSQIFDYSFHVLSHNRIRGAAGGSLLIGELLFDRGVEGS